MARVVEALQGDSDADLHALIDWMLSHPPHRNSSDQAPASRLGEKLLLDSSQLQSEAFRTTPSELSAPTLYNSACASCHGIGGEGSRDGHFPSMFHNSSVGRRTAHNLLAALLEGLERQTESSSAFMQSFDGSQGTPGGLSDNELAALSNFVLKQFGAASAATIDSQLINRSRLVWWGSGEPTAANGQQIAVGGGPGGPKAACFACHGLNGQGDAGSGSPRLAGMDVTYFAKQMRDYASGRRPNGAMTPIAQQLTPVDHHSLALYYTALPPEPKIATNVSHRSLLQAGETLYARGAPERGIQACSTCHGQAGRGFGAVFPSVLQPASYTAEQLRSWRNGIRRNDELDLMAAASGALTDDDIRALAAYVGELTP